MKAQLMGIAVGLMMATVGVVQAAAMKNSPGTAEQLTYTSAQLSPEQRSAIVGAIVAHWAPYVEKVQKTSGGAWSRRMQSTFAQASGSNLVRAAGMKTFQGMVGALTGQRLSDTQVLDSLATQAQMLGSGPVPALLGSATADLVYTPLAPCRMADTRVAGAGGPIASGATRGFYGWTDTNFAVQGGITNSNCGIPKHPSALMLNVTVVSPTAAGFLTVFPFGTTQPSASNLNYAIGAVVGNEIAAKMTIGSSTYDFSVFAFGQTNVVIDAVGYFDAPNATALDCIQVNGTSVAVPDTFANFGTSPMPSCPATYTPVSASCSTSNEAVLLLRVSDTIGCSAVDRVPGDGGTGTVQTIATCCRVPGR